MASDTTLTCSFKFQHLRCRSSFLILHCSEATSNYCAAHNSTTHVVQNETGCAVFRTIDFVYWGYSFQVRSIIQYLSSIGDCLGFVLLCFCSFITISSLSHIFLSHQYFRGTNHPLLNFFEGVVIRILEIWSCGWSVILSLVIGLYVSISSPSQSCFGAIGVFQATDRCSWSWLL